MFPSARIYGGGTTIKKSSKKGKSPFQNVTKNFSDKKIIHIEKIAKKYIPKVDHVRYIFQLIFPNMKFTKIEREGIGEYSKDVGWMITNKRYGNSNFAKMNTKSGEILILCIRKYIAKKDLVKYVIKNFVEFGKISVKDVKKLTEEKSKLFIVKYPI